MTPTNHTFQVGDSVKIKAGIQDVNFDTDLSGYQGYITDIHQEASGTTLLTLEWDSQTLRNIPEEDLIQCYRQGYACGFYTLPAEEVLPADPRDTREETKRTRKEIEALYQYVPSGRTLAQSARIEAVLEQARGNDEMDLLRAMKKHLADQLDFPFEATVLDTVANEPVSAGDTVTVQGITRLKRPRSGGVIVGVTHNDETLELRLYDLLPTDETSDNYQHIDDYRELFASL